jgi:hypothetical protein
MPPGGVRRLGELTGLPAAPTATRGNRKASQTPRPGRACSCPGSAHELAAAPQHDDQHQRQHHHMQQCGRDWAETASSHSGTRIMAGASMAAHISRVLASRARDTASRRPSPRPWWWSSLRRPAPGSACGSTSAPRRPGRRAPSSPGPPRPHTSPRTSPGTGGGRGGGGRPPGGQGGLIGSVHVGCAQVYSSLASPALPQRLFMQS